MAGFSPAARRCRNRSAMSSTHWTSSRPIGVDPLRYFLLREVTFGQDGSYTHRGDRQPGQCRSRQQLRQSRPAHLVVHRPAIATARCRWEGRATPPTTPCSRSSDGRRAPSFRRSSRRWRSASGHRGLAEGGLRLQPIYRHPGALDPAQDRPRADERGPRDALRGDPRPRHRHPAGDPGLGRGPARPDGRSGGRAQLRGARGRGQLRTARRRRASLSRRRRRSSRGSERRARAERDRPPTGRHRPDRAARRLRGALEGARTAADGRAPADDDPPVPTARQCLRAAGQSGGSPRSSLPRSAAPTSAASRIAGPAATSPTISPRPIGSAAPRRRNDDGRPGNRYMPPMFVDSHCHLNYKGLVEDQAGRARPRPRRRGLDDAQHLDPRLANGTR